jgi:glycosyltransferase involved in cell wall biosynthesis
VATLDVVLPVFNEARVLERSVRALHLFLEDNVLHEWRIVIADNGSRDATYDIAQRLASELSNVAAIHVPEAGRGRALTGAWLASEADVLAYMDIDLSTDLEAFPRLVNAVARGAIARLRPDHRRDVPYSPGGHTVRLQGDWPCLCPPATAPDSGHRLVLGHGVAAAGGARRLERGLHPGALGGGQRQ